MTALRKFLPCDHEAQFHVDRFDAFSTFIDALNAPLPAIICDASLFGLRPQSRRQNTSKTIAVSTMGDGT